MVKGKDRVGTKIFFVEGKKNEEKAYNRLPAKSIFVACS